MWMIRAVINSGDVWEIVDTLEQHLIGNQGDPNIVLKDNIVLSLKKFAEALEKYEKYRGEYQFLMDRIHQNRTALNNLKGEENDLNQEIVGRGIDIQIQERSNLQTELEDLKQQEQQVISRHHVFSSQMKNNYEMLQNVHRDLVNELEAVERDYNAILGQYKAVNEALRGTNAELRAYDLQVGLKNENAKNALVIASLKSRNMMLKLEREAQERKYLQAKELLENLEREREELDIQFRQSSLGSEELRDEKAKYDKYMKRLKEYEDVEALYNSIKDMDRELKLTEDLVKDRSAELKSLMELSETLNENLARRQRLVDSAEKPEDFPGSIASLKHQVSKKCEDLVESIQAVYRKKAEYKRALEDQYFLRNLVSGVLTFFSLAIAAHLFVPSIFLTN